MVSKWLDSVTLGIITADRYDRLFSLLQSLASQPYRFRILTIDNSRRLKDWKSRDQARVQNFLRYTGFEHTIEVVVPGQSMFQLRQTLLEGCTTKFLWMADDDVALVGSPLDAFLLGAIKKFGYLQGTKVDIENTEGYADHSVFAEELQTAPGGIPKWFYLYKKELSFYPPTCVMDCGNVFIDVQAAKSVGGFSLRLPLSYTKGKTSEDVLLGGRLASKYDCRYVSDSIVFHFPKRKMRFKTKDPRWLLSLDPKLLRINKKVREQLNAFYRSKFKT